MADNPTAYQAYLDDILGVDARTIDAEEPASSRFAITTPARADWALKKLGELEQELRDRATYVADEPARLKAWQAREAAKAKRFEDVPMGQSPLPKAVPQEEADRTDLAEITPDYMPRHEVEALREWAQQQGYGEMLEQLLAACEGYPDAPKVSPMDYLRARNAVRTAIAQAAQAPVPEAPAAQEDETA